MPRDHREAALRVVHFSTADNEGGSARSAYRIHSALRSRGHQSRMLVRYRVTDDPDVDTVSGGRVLARLDREADRVTSRLGYQYAFVPSASRVRRHPWLADPDIVQLYNVHGGYFSPDLLPWLAHRGRLVWRLSDMWAATGHCAYSGNCERWRTGCGKCPDLATYPPIATDRTARNWEKKQRLYARTPMTIVAPSSWAENIARESPLLGRFPIVRIPNGLDTGIFRPQDQAEARQRLGVPAHGTAMLFSSHIAFDNPRKGSEILRQALIGLGERANTHLLVAGVGAEQWQGKVPLNVVLLGYLRDDRDIAAAYAAADFTVVPSAVENLPNSVIESMACGRPAVAFDSGGMGDAVRHRKTGLLVPTGDTDGFAAAIAEMLGDAGMRAQFGANALRLATDEFTADVQSRRFIDLYRDLLGTPAA